MRNEVSYTTVNGRTVKTAETVDGKQTAIPQLEDVKAPQSECVKTPQSECVKTQPPLSKNERDSNDGAKKGVDHEPKTGN